MDQTNNLPELPHSQSPLAVSSSSPAEARLAALLPPTSTVRRRVFATLLRTIISGGDL